MSMIVQAPFPIVWLSPFSLPKDHYSPSSSFPSVWNYSHRLIIVFAAISTTPLISSDLSVLPRVNSSDIILFPMHICCLQLNLAAMDMMDYEAGSTKLVGLPDSGVVQSHSSYPRCELVRQRSREERVRFWRWLACYSQRLTQISRGSIGAPLSVVCGVIWLHMDSTSSDIGGDVEVCEAYAPP